MKSKFHVPFETAKMLKKAGYPQSGSDMYYNPNGKLMTQAEVIAGYKDVFPISITDCYAAPAYHEVLDWLEEKGIRIEVRVAYQFRERKWSWRGYVYVVEDEDYETSQLADLCSTREQALNASILKALEML